VDVELVAHSTQAEITFADIQQIDGLLGSKTTTYATGDRGDNIHLAASRINGTLLRPGEVFSYNRVVGPRSSSEGFKDAPVIIKGELKPGIGGGICQTSSTLYNAVLLSGLKIVHRAHHAFPVHYLPAGRDATVVDGDIDFQFQNSTATPIYVVGRGRGGVLTFSIYGKRIPGREIVMEKGRDIIGAYPTRLEEDPTLRAGHREVKRRGFPDRRVTWYRVVRQNGQEVSRETINTHYSAIDEIVAVGTRQSAPRRRTAPKPAPTHITPPAVPPATPPATTPQGQQ
jgi:vancomycin resistance protein YoaR